ncbi:hypothetical protein TRFO_10854 [Tritrichomonas foetus]|uniref:PCI domain-containing protein n=1 Tax=Tritrichomonas foetus TaxID=1144522 RepID=A0A1J4J6T5_9EUKA|nr:hypothetical protein TRFO_10854 [Tritrichomonas foetus]|eukprot:OHS94904.1 hypothetical protein TRFO_10854 [Tritrichomonas foetus]
MTERQRLITKYISKLSKATATRYNLHFLSQPNNDESARHMLLDNLEIIRKDTGNAELGNVIDDVSSRKTKSITFGHQSKTKSQSKSKFSESHADRDPFTQGVKKNSEQRAITLFNSLFLEDSLNAFEKAKKDLDIRNKYYEQRAEINLVLGRYREAIALASKCRLYDMAFVAAIAAGELDYAQMLVACNLRAIESQKPDKDVVATTFEMIHLLLFICFAKSTSKETEAIARQIFNNTNYELTFLKEMTELFINRQFYEFIQKLGELKDIFDLSIYTSPSSLHLISAIKANIVANEVEPYASLSFDELNNKLGLSNDEIASILRTLIREGRVNGKIDLINNVYIGGVADLQGRQMDDLINRTVLVRQNFQLNLWKQEYNQINTSKKT